MPRDSAGNYTLPAGNPVVSGTVIQALWANTTMPDLGAEMTDSLSRSGQGGMLVPLRLVDGMFSSPAFSFTSEPTLGMFRAEAGVLGFSGGAIELARLKLNGNFSVTGAAPAVDADLTRKDYVDSSIAVVDGQVAQNTIDIAQNASDIADNDVDIAQNASDIAQNVLDIAQNASDIGDNSADIAALVLDDLNDVDTTTVPPVLDNALVFDGAQWVPGEGGGGAAITISPTPPVAPNVGDAWWDSETGRAYIYYDDGDSQQWVQEDPQVGSLPIVSGGKVLQAVTFADGEVATGTGVIPEDDTVPEINQGDQYLAASITPKSATSKIRVDVKMNVANTNSDAKLIATLFRDGANDALAVTYQQETNPNRMLPLSIIFWADAVADVSTTFTVRAGASAAGTTTFNGDSGSRLFGGKLDSSITLTEYAS